jgi:hypothetical protein
MYYGSPAPGRAVCFPKGGAAVKLTSAGSAEATAGCPKLVMAPVGSHGAV